MPQAPGPKRQMRRHGEAKALVEELLQRSRAPASAYDLCRRSADAHTPLHAAQIYRALGELVAEGKVRRIETLNAYCLGAPGRTAIAICEVCGETAQIALDGVQTALRSGFEDAGFTPSQLMVESVGRCRKCRQGEHGT